MKRPLLILSLLFLTSSVQNQMIVTGPKMPLNAAAAPSYTETLDSWQFGTLVASEVIDGTDYWHFSIGQLDGTLQ